VRHDGGLVVIDGAGNGRGCDGFGCGAVRGFCNSGEIRP
jgi:hypothetical protein